MRAGEFVKSDSTNGNQGTCACRHHVARHSSRQRSPAAMSRLGRPWPRQFRDPRFDTRS